MNILGQFYSSAWETSTNCSMKMLIAAPVLGLALTSRDKNAENPIPMAGFPWHALEDNLKIMLKSGFKVTVAEQEQELREGAKLLERVVTRIYTPGSLYEESLLSTDDRSVLSSIILAKSSLSMAIMTLLLVNLGHLLGMVMRGLAVWKTSYSDGILQKL